MRCRNLVTLGWMRCQRTLSSERKVALKMVVMGEARGTPSYVSPVMQSPRYGGCVSSFFKLFDWPSAKRLSSKKRLSASKSEKGSFRRSRSFRTDHGKTRKRHDEHVAAPMRPPGVVARLMGLESLPEAPYPRHRRSQGSSTSRLDHSITSPVLLQDLLQQDFKPFKPNKPNKSLRDRLFSKRVTRRHYATRKGSSFPTFRCRSEEWCISPAFVDIPQAQSRFMYSVTQKQKPFLSRLPTSGEAIPELSLLQARSTGRDVVLQGWPLGGQHNVPPDLYHETETSSSERPQESESVGSKPTDSASSKPLLMNSKMAHGRRRSSSCNGSDDSESTIEGPPSRQRRNVKKTSPPSLQSQAPRHTNKRSKPIAEPEFKGLRRRGSARSPGERQPLMIPAEISRTSVSFASTGTSQSSTSEFRSVSSKAPLMAGQARGSRAGRPSGKSGKNSPIKNASSQVGKTTTTAKMKSKEHLVKSPAMAPGKPPPGKVGKAKAKGSPSLDPQSDISADRLHHIPKPSLHSHSKLVHSKPPASLKLQKFTEKAAASGVVIKPKGIQQVEGVGDRLKTGNNTNAQDMASQSEPPVLSTSKRIKITITKPLQSQPRSVDALFPELPLDSEFKGTDTVRLRRPIDNVLFSPDFDFTECSNGDAPQISMSPLIDYSELCDSGEYGKGVSTSPSIDFVELRGDCNVPTAENESISVESYPVCWEDEIVETILSGRCCERSCSGPSISSRSLTFSEEERNGDSWSSSASYNPGECDSPSDGMSDSPRTTIQVKEREVEAEVLDPEPKSPPVQKVLEERLVDEAAGQPSPVSVLQSPFDDETCTTSESSPESIRQLSPEQTTREDRTLPISNIDRIKQALIDISTFRLSDPPSTTSHPPSSTPSNEPLFISSLLSYAHFLGSSSPSWHTPDLALDPSLFDKLESEGNSALASGGLWRCDRKLLFDCVNEAVVRVSTRLWQWAPVERVWGEELVVSVGMTIEEWRGVAKGAGVEGLVERDLRVHLGHWRVIAPEVVEVGVEIESGVWEGVLEEVVGDFVRGGRMSRSVDDGLECESVMARSPCATAGSSSSESSIISCMEDCSSIGTLQDINPLVQRVAEACT